MLALRNFIPEVPQGPVQRGALPLEHSEAVAQRVARRKQRRAPTRRQEFTDLRDHVWPTLGMASVIPATVSAIAEAFPIKVSDYPAVYR
jgi:hypothetical protein